MTWLLPSLLACQAPPRPRDLPRFWEARPADGTADTGSAVDTAVEALQIDRQASDSFAWLEIEEGHLGLATLGSHYAIVDVDLDGRGELVLSGEPGTFVYEIPDHGGPILSTEAIAVFPDEAVTQMVRADVDGDGHDDVVSFSKPSLGPSFLLAHLSGERFEEPAYLEFTRIAGLPTVAVGDLDGDGFQDIAIDPAGPDYHVLEVFHGPLEPGVTYSPTSRWNVEGRNPNDLLCPGDVDGDGVDDLVGYYAPPTVLFEGPLPPGRFDEVVIARELKEYSFSPKPLGLHNYDGQGADGMIMTDLDGITLLGIYRFPVAWGDQPHVSVFDELVDEGRQSSQSEPDVLATDDVNGDGIADLWIHSRWENGVQYLFLGPFPEDFGTREGWTVRLWSPEASGGVTWPAFGHVDDDGILDFVVRDRDDTVHVHLLGDLAGLPTRASSDSAGSPR